MSRLEHVIARNVAQLRAERGATQHDLAEMMRVYGFTWQTNRVAQIETLRRPVSLLEVVGLSAVFNVAVTRLLAGDDEIDLPNGGTMPLHAVRAHLTEPHTDLPAPAPDRVRQDSGEDLRKVAARIGIDPSTLQDVAERMWGHSFWVERAKRLGNVDGLGNRSVQTKRGHVTRALSAEVREWMASQNG